MIDSNMLFIGSLPWSTTEEELMEELEKYGRVLTLRIVIQNDKNHPRYGKSMGFGFITMETVEDAQNVHKSMNNKPYKNRVIGIKRYVPRESR